MGIGRRTCVLLNRNRKGYSSCDLWVAVINRFIVILGVIELTLWEGLGRLLGLLGLLDGNVGG